VSKLWIECAQLEERNGHMQRARAAYVRSVANCAGRCGWGGTRIEPTHGQLAAAHALRSGVRTRSRRPRRARS